MKTTRKYAWLAACAGTVAVTVGLVPRSAVADYAAHVLASSPLGYWRLGEGPGSTLALDASGGGRNLTYSLFSANLYGHPGAIGGDPNTALRFQPTPGGDAPSGSPNTHPTLISPNTTDFGFVAGESFSIEFWIKMAQGNASTNGASLISKGYDTHTQFRPWYLSRYVNGGVDFFLRTGDPQANYTVTSGNITDGQWHYVVGVYDANAAQILLYVDAQPVGGVSNVRAGDYGINSRPLVVGGGHFNRGLDGMMDEVAIYGHALSQSAIFDRFTVAGQSSVVGEARPWLKVDFGNIAGSGGGPGGLQTRHSPLLGTETPELLDVRRVFGSQLGQNDTVTVTIGGYTHFRNYAAVVDGFSNATALLSDMVLRNANGTLSLTLEDLKPGIYELTTYHHSTQFGGGLFDVHVTDTLGVSRSIASDVTVSAAANPAEVSRLSFQIHTDGSTPVRIDFTGGEVSQHLALNGFQLAAAKLVATERVLAVDFNARIEPEALVPAATQNGFVEFVMDGVAGSRYFQATTRSFGQHVVTLSPAGPNPIDDRRRTVPVNGGFFSDEAVLRDFVFLDGREFGITPDDGLNVRIEGLEPDAAYEVRLWAYDRSSINVRVSDWYANGQLAYKGYSYNGADVPGFNDDFSFSFFTTANADGELLLTGRTGAGSAAPDISVFLNALEISKVTGSLVNADLNNDRRVNRLDVLELMRNYGLTGEPEALGDLNGDGHVGLSDVALMQKNLDVPQIPAPVAAVPEPSAWSLIALGGLTLGVGMRRGKGRRVRCQLPAGKPQPNRSS
jgi:hypothetical protein